jgi:hypothetical protein
MSKLDNYKNGKKSETAEADNDQRVEIMDTKGMDRVNIGSRGEPTGRSTAQSRERIG